MEEDLEKQCEGWVPTEKGLNTAIDMHEMILSGSTIEDVAFEYQMSILEVQIMLTILFSFAEENNLPIAQVPDSPEGL